jgi:hypothetical protein
MPAHQRENSPLASAANHLQPRQTKVHWGGAERRAQPVTRSPDSADPYDVEVSSFFVDALKDAERLLKYAAEMGIDIDDGTRSAVLHARAVPAHKWTEEMSASLLLALTALAAKLKPVTAESLKAYHSETRPTMHTYLVWAIILSIVIIPTSILTFVSSSISDSIKNDITKANGLAVKLHTELGSDARPDVGTSEELTDLQEYAATVRSIYARSRKLNRLLIPHADLPLGLRCRSDKEDDDANCIKTKFELPYELKVDQFPAARDRITETYQDVRYFAQNITTDILTFYGAINSCILPILYALLGTCAYLLRSFEDQMSTRTFTPSVANSARFLIAAIGGTVIGLFGNFTSQTSASPLAMAFLVGYGVEIFFSFLENLIKSFTRAPPPPPCP